MWYVFYFALVICETFYSILFPKVQGDRKAPGASGEAILLLKLNYLKKLRLWGVDQALRSPGLRIPWTSHKIIISLQKADTIFRICLLNYSDIFFKTENKS